jgi:hypothetical protein
VLREAVRQAEARVLRQGSEVVKDHVFEPWARRRRKEAS